ncbi:MAG: hypothetical protein KDD27_08170 [Saprospiraceae bacterium]|nr:hypothetical protein [Saprospiraceae bacterium]
MIKYRLVLLLFFVGDWVLAQSPDRLFFNHLTQANGLSQTTNNVVYTDSRGFVWISSLNGLNRYDGQQIKVYKHRQGDPFSLPDNYIQSRIIEEENGDLWFSTYGALVCYVRKNDQFVSYAATDENRAPLKGYHLAFQKPQQQLGVVVGGNGLYFFDSAKKSWCFEHSLPPGTQRVVPIFSNTGDHTGLAVFSYDQPGIYFIEYNSTVGLLKQPRFIGQNSEPSLRPSDALQEGDSLLRVATQAGFLTVNLKNGGYWQLLPTTGWYPNDLDYYQNGQLITSLTGGGLAICKKDSVLNGKQFFHVPGNPWTLASNITTGIRQDRNGVIWTGTAGIGVDFAQPDKVKFQSLDLGKLFSIEDRTVGIYGMAEDSIGNIWCIARGFGLFVLSPDKKPLAKFSKEDTSGGNLPANSLMYHFFDRKNRCWALTLRGIGLLSPGGEGFQALESPKGFLHGIELKNGRGLLFSSLTGGILKAVETSGNIRLEMLPEIGNTAAYTYLFQNKKGWLYACRDLTSIEVRNPEDDFAMLKNLPIKGDVHGFHESTDGTLWIATGNGLVKLNQGNWQFETFTEAEGLPDDHVYGILANAADSTLWLTTNRGIAQFFPNEIPPRFHAFDMPDGLQGLEFNSHGFLRRPNGEFWFAGMNGVNYFNPDSIQMLQVMPQVQFTRLLVNNEERPHPMCALTGAMNISEVKKLVFDFTENTLNFEFAALEFSHPAKNQFQYMLENYETNWTPPTTSGFARYANLPPGSYKLLVKACNSDGVWSKPKALEIVVHPPVWQRWWFVLLAAVALVASGYGIYRWRIGQLLKVERLRNQISADLHDDIGATLSNVNILTTLVRQKLPTDSGALPLLARIEEEVQSSAESLDDIIWSINPQNDPLDRVLARMRRFASEVLEAKGIEGQINFPAHAGHLRLDMAKRRHFYLLFKEAINNMAKYAHCSRATINVVYENGRLQLAISDNGVGFDPEVVKEGGNGMQTMRQRAEILGALLEISSAIGQGTTVSVSFPITENRDSRV